MNTLKMDHFVASSISEILNNGVNSLGARPKYASDGKTANSKYITDVFIKFYLDKGELPISRLRPVYTGLARQEVFWLYQDQTSDLQPLRDRGVHWWEDWALEDGTIGQRYGATVNRYKLIDRLIEGLEKNPYNRRNIINLWQYKDLDETEGFEMITGPNRGYDPETHNLLGLEFTIKTVKDGQFESLGKYSMPTEK